MSGEIRNSDYRDRDAAIISEGRDKRVALRGLPMAPVVLAAYLTYDPATSTITVEGVAEHCPEFDAETEYALMQAWATLMGDRLGYVVAPKDGTRLRVHPDSPYGFSGANGRFL